MCNDYRLEVEIASIMEDFNDLEIAIETPEGIPNLAPRADIKISQRFRRDGVGSDGRRRRLETEACS